MIDIKFLRENPDVVKQNIKNKFQNDKLPLVDEVIELDKQARAAQQEADALRANKNTIAKQIGSLMAQGKKAEAEEVKKQVAETSARLKELETLEPELKEKVKKIMMIIPNIIDPSVPIGKDDSENVEVQRYGEPVVPNFEIPYHADIMESLGGIDLDSARKVAGNGFYYLMGDIARLHSAIISYARDFMIDRGFTYCIPPFMIISATPYQWKHMIGQRTCRRNTDETRIVMLQIWQRLYKLSPILFAPDLTGPFCQRGSCMEKQMSCQNPISKLWIPSDILKADYPLLIRREVSSHKD